jgi:hypothetical protein
MATPSQQSDQPASHDVVAASGALNLELAKLNQERELKEKELALRGQELEFQRQQTGRARWSTPAVVAIVAGLIGYAGTLLSSWQGRQLEREKNEATLILEAIKTGGTADEKARQTAANLIFLADAGLISSIKPAEVERLRVKAGGAGPSLPAPQGVVDFKRSTSLTEDLQSKLQVALREYEASLVKAGYDAGQAKERVTVRVDEEQRDNAFFDNENVVLGVNLARDPEYALSEYTWYVLKQANRRAFDTLWKSTAPQFNGYAYGMKYYFVCSHLNEPYVGKNYQSLVGGPAKDRSKPYLFNLDQFRRFDGSKGADALEPHNLGEVWGGAFWELRKSLGREKVDRFLLAAWKEIDTSSGSLNKPKFFVDAIVTASGVDQDAEIIRQAFVRRGLK